MGIFGFSTEPSSGDFTAIIKYDARAGRIIRVDRFDAGGGNFQRQETDITGEFVALFDLENVEVGWINFPQGGAPHAVLVPFTPEKLVLPPQPSEQYKNGIRFLVKLHASCADGQDEVREVMTTAKAALNGIEELVKQYQAERAANGNGLPVCKLEKVTPIKTGSGSKTSTNYTPHFKIIGWTQRPSTFVFTPKGAARPTPAPAQASMFTGNGQTQAPATGATRVAPPQQQAQQVAPVRQQPAAVDPNDFG